MHTQHPEYHGPPDQKALQRRADTLWSLVRDDPRFLSHGRTVCTDHCGSGQVALQVSLARLQGGSACEAVPAAAVANRITRLEAAGLKTDQFEYWRSGPDALDAAQGVLNDRTLPPDLELVSVDADTPSAVLAALDKLTQSCGVLLPNGAFMRGKERPAVCLFARDRQGVPVSVTAAVAMFHPDHPRRAQSWWGMLATSPKRRGEGLARIMGAHSILEMHDRFGISQFFTGIRADNTPSQKLCSTLGLAPSGEAVVIAMDPGLFTSGRITS